MKTAKRPHPMREAIGRDQLVRSLNEMTTPIASIPEAEMASWFESMSALSRQRHDDARLNVNKLAGAWLRVAAVAWPHWPPQESGE